MKGYIYRLYRGADPAKGWTFNDPIFGSPPTLGACVPNIRRAVEVGDWVFAISGKAEGYRPYVVGGFQVAKKIDALQAYKQLPNYRLERAENGQVLGNIIVDSKGQHHKLDDHDGFKARLKNYLVGGASLHVKKPEHVEIARAETLPTLAKIFSKPGNRDFDIVPRWRKMDEEQIEDLKAWLAPLSK
jgi:Nucleotide modification associated domain 2